MLFGMLRIREAYPITVQTNASDMFLGSVERRKKCDPERVGYGSESGEYGEASDARRLWSMKKFP